MPEELFKIRFRFPGGEEFEAQGNREFIEQQRNYFLALIGKNNTNANVLSITPAVQRQSKSVQPEKATETSLAGTAQTDFSALSILPTVQRLSEKQSTHAILSSSAASEPSGPNNDSFPALRLWERILKEDGDIVFLRKKMRITAQEAALILLAGTRVLLKKPSCLALNLSRSMHKSGFSEGRLDRLLAPDIRNGHLTSDGTKRGRTYRLTNEGFAKAFVLAEKLSAELL